MTYEEQREVIKNLEARIADLEAALAEAIDGWEDGANYKGDYLREKHRDAEGIAKVRAVLQKSKGGQ